jgi:hypothetical protein
VLFLLLFHEFALDYITFLLTIQEKVYRIKIKDSAARAGLSEGGGHRAFIVMLESENVSGSESHGPLDIFVDL